MRGNSNYWVVKLDSRGKIQWQKCYGGSGLNEGDGARSIQLTPDHGYVVAGVASSNDGDVTGNHDGYGQDYWIIKLDSTGNLQWQKCYGGSDNDWANSIQVTPDHGFIVAGFASSNNGDVGGNHIGYITGGTTFGDYWVIKLDSAGNLRWQRCYGGSSEEDMANSIQPTPDGGYVVAGYSHSNDGDVSGNHGSADYWIVKINDGGGIEWKKCYGGSGLDEAEFIQPTPDGGYIVAGSSSSNDDDVSGNHDLPSMPMGDYWIVKLAGPCYAQFNLSASSNNICPGTPVTFTTVITNGGNTPSWSWSINGSAITGDTANIYTSSSLHNGDSVVCSLSNGPGCTPVKDTMAMAVNRIPSVSITADTTSVCSGSPVRFTAYPLWEGANPVYQWKVNSLTTGTNDTIFSTNDLQNGDVVTCDLISNDNRCVPTVTSNPIVMTVHPFINPSITVTANATAICTGVTTSFTASTVNGGTHPSYQWEINGINTATNQNTLIINSLHNGDLINCLLTSDLLCAAPVTSNSITMTVDQVPVVTCRPDTVLFEGTMLRLNTVITGGNTTTDTYLWTPAAGLDNAGIPSPLAIPSQTTDYLLEVTTPGGCTAGCRVVINVKHRISVPNAFSPNGDGINDIWAIPALADYPGCTVDVFDRSGQPVFHSTGYNQPWDGTFHAKPVPFGTYYYIINPKNGFQRLSGAVTILR
jgi:gliding motility-associated-like protein